MLIFNHCRILCRAQDKVSKNVLGLCARSVFSSGGRNYETTEELVIRPDARARELNQYANWELLRDSGDRFCLPGNVGLFTEFTTGGDPYQAVSRVRKHKPYVTLPDTNYSRHKEIFTQLSVLAGELVFITDGPGVFYYHAIECPILIKEQVMGLFPRANIGVEPLTAVCIAMKTLPKNFEKDWTMLLKQYEETGRRMCMKLNQAGFWADFPSSQAISRSKSQTQIEAAQILGPPGVIIRHTAGCLLILHLSPLESKVFGWLFTTAPPNHPKLNIIFEQEDKFSEDEISEDEFSDNQSSEVS